MNISRHLLTIAAASLAAVLPAAANAQNFDNISRGAYTQAGVFGTGGSGTADGNFITGVSNPNTYHSFFVFDLAGFAGNATSASVSFNAPSSFSSGAAPYTLSIFDYSGSIAALTSNTGGVAAYNDLGTGALLGTATVSGAANVFTLTFNSAGVAAVNAAAGGQFAFGGALLGAPAQTFIFGGSLNEPPVVLALAAPGVPEPATWGMLLLGFGGMGYAMRRRQNSGARIRFA